MKIAHICFTNPYIDGWAYQENILPQYHVKLGCEVVVLASNILPEYLKYKKIDVGKYWNGKVLVYRLKSIRISASFVISRSLYRYLKKEKPDIIFHHNVNCTSLIICSLYKLFHVDVGLFVDNHADNINCSKNRLYRFLFYNCLLGSICYLISPLVKKFYGVTKSRCDFLHQMYWVSKKKIDFLPIGADIEQAKELSSVRDLRAKFGFSDHDFILISGGKMGVDKGTDILIKVFEELSLKQKQIKLVLIGNFTDFYTKKLSEETKGVFYEGWCDRNKTLEFLKLSDVAVWPVHHTTLIEDAIAVGTPLILRKTRTTEHLIKENGLFIDNATYDEIYHSIILFFERKNERRLREGCIEIQKELDYRKISQKIIDDYLV